jgi:hypothetical protein
MLQQKVERGNYFKAVGDVVDPKGSCAGKKSVYEMRLVRRPLKPPKVSQRL